MVRSKRYREGSSKIEKEKEYSFEEALDVLLAFPKAKFDETVEMSFNLGIDTKKSDQAVRGTIALPHGTGKKVRVAVIAQGDDAKAAEQAGADFVGHQELIKKISEGWLDFDVMISTPDNMRDLGKLGRVLGPRGLMPSPKAGTVTKDVAAAVKEVKAGKIEFKADKGANVQVPIGKASFPKEKLKENGLVVISSLAKSRPSAAKGAYIRSITLSSTMGPGLRVSTREAASTTK
jgi:large subunit ribosomal protein L1